MTRIFHALLLFCALIIPVFSFAQGSQNTYKEEVTTPLIFTGYYVGTNLGWKWASFSTSIDTTPYETLAGIVPQQTFEYGTDTNVFDAGVQVGFNYQMRHFLFGLEADWNGMSIGDQETLDATINSPVFQESDSFKTTSLWEASYRFRLGYVLNNWLFYGTTGLSHAKIEVKTTFIAPTILGNNINLDEDGILTGWTLGIGTEYLITKYWSVGLEYRHTGYGNTKYNLGNIIVPTSLINATEVTATVDGYKTDQILAKINFRVVA